MFVVNASHQLPPFPGGIQLLTKYMIAKNSNTVFVALNKKSFIFSDFYVA